MVNKKYDIDKNSDFVINLLKDRISFLERQLIEKKPVTDFLVKHQISPVATYSNINCDNKILNHELTEAIKNKTLPNNNIGKGDRKKVIILGDSLLNGINEKVLSKKHNVKIANKPGATSERLLLEELDNLIKYQPGSVIIHAGTNDLTNGIKMLNNAKKIVKELTAKLPKVKIVSSGEKKDKKNLDKNIIETNKRLKNYCRQKDIV